MSYALPGVLLCFRLTAVTAAAADAAAAASCCRIPGAISAETVACAMEGGRGGWVVVAAEDKLGGDMEEVG